MNEAEFWQKLMTIAIFSGMTLLTWLKVFASNIWRLQLLVLMLLAHILAAIIQPEGLFQSPLLITVLFLICGITVYVFLNKRKMEENQ
jgi:Sec-independent protein secretion pathway component TatC